MDRTRVTIAILLLAMGCGGEGNPDAAAQAELPPGNTVAQTYARELGIDLDAMTRSATGLYTLDLAEGSGEPAQPGVVVRVHYTGWMPDGSAFDSSVGREPFSFALGMGRVIEGWEEGVVGMRPGGRRRLVIPPALAYGEGGYPGAIPPNATLVFEVELLEVIRASEITTTGG